LTETVDDIHEQHLAQHWAGIGYHGVIYPDGTGIQGRPFNMIPAAAQGLNTESVDICLIGNFQSDDPGFTGPPTQAQIDTLIKVFAFLGTIFPNIDKTIGHRDVAPLIGDPSVATACPGNLLEAQLPEIRTKIALMLQNGNREEQNEGNAP
jgi:hypothetical protein